MRLLQAEAAAHGHVANVGHRQVARGGAAQHVVVGADTFNGAQGARPEAATAAVAGAQVHRHAGQRHPQVAEVWRLPVDVPSGRVQQGGHARIGCAARAAVVDDVRGHRTEVGVMDGGLVVAAEAGAQRRQAFRSKAHVVFLKGVNKGGVDKVAPMHWRHRVGIDQSASAGAATGWP
ncbi:hypothetical protein D3C71_863450 [compost metagenome]